MQKSTINLKGVDYVVRTIDVRSIPSFGDYSYASVDVAEDTLWDAIEREAEQGDKYAVRLDETIFFYVDAELMRRDASDEEIVNYIRQNI